MSCRMNTLIPLVATFVLPNCQPPYVSNKPVKMITDFDVGMFCYVGGMVGFTMWEYKVVPQLKRKGIIPDVPLIEGDITEAQKDLKWMTPLTCDNQLPLPTFDDLKNKGAYRIGSTNGIHQVITLTPSKAYPLDKVAVRSLEWSLHYNTTVFIHKQRIK